MSRVKRGTTKNKARKYTLSQTKGYRLGRKSKKRQAYEAIVHAGTYAFNHRKDKKGVFRRGWQNVIGYAVKKHGISYSKFTDLLKKKGISLNRKILAELVRTNPESFDRIVEQVK